MGNTSIQWTDRVWNPVRGCARVSPGCDNCYAMRQAHRFSTTGGPYEGLTVLRKGKVDWRGHARLESEMLAQPLRWRKPSRVFVNSMSDLFHPSLTDEEIAAVFGVMAASPEHTFQVLTKRPERMVDWFQWAHNGAFDRVLCHADDALKGSPVAFAHLAWAGHGGRPTGWPLRNVWLGVSVENQKTADERIPILQEVPAAVRFISAEPLLGPIDLKDLLGASRTLHMHLDIADALQNKRLLRAFTEDDGTRRISPKRAERHLRDLLAKGHKVFPMCKCEDFDPFERGCVGRTFHKLDWVIVGGESGHGARPCATDWVEGIVTQCNVASVPVFVKQLGRSPVTNPGTTGEFRISLADKTGGNPAEWPTELRVREFPRSEAR